MFVLPGESYEGGGGGSVDLPEAILAKLRESGYDGVIPGPGHELPAQQLETVNKWGFQAEELIHGTPSGIDNSISTFGEAMPHNHVHTHTGTQ